MKIFFNKIKKQVFESTSDTCYLPHLSSQTPILSYGCTFTRNPAVPAACIH